MTTPIKTKRSSLLKVRVREHTKERIKEAAEILDLDQSSLIRNAVLEYLERHCPDAK